MKNLEKIFEALRGVSLSHRERHNMRLHLQMYTHEHPMRTSFWAQFSNAIHNAFSAESILGSKTIVSHPAWAVCVLVLCVSLGTSYAAESALPGEALYSFKTSVNEQVEGAFATSPQAKAEWSAELTNRRLQEAEELAATNQLSPVASAAIEHGLDNAVQNFNSDVTLLSKGDDVQAANVQSDLEASLNAHEAVLASLPTSATSSAFKITSLVRRHADHLSKARSYSEATLIATDSPEVRSAALSQQKSAQDEVDQTQLLSADTIDTQVASSVSSITLEASGDIQAGKSDAKRGHWGRAYGAFQDAIRKMKETQDSVDTRNWLKKSFNIGFDTSATSTVQNSSDQNNSHDGHSDTTDNFDGSDN